MDDDLIERLRSFAADYNLDPSDTQTADDLTNEAADRIEQWLEQEATDE